MARSLVIEEESGTSRGFLHPHNGYYAGDFCRADVDARPAPLLARSPEQATLLRMPTGIPHVDGHTRPLAA